MMMIGFVMIRFRVVIRCRGIRIMMGGRGMVDRCWGIEVWVVHRSRGIRVRMVHRGRSIGVMMHRSIGVMVCRRRGRGMMNWCIGVRVMHSYRSIRVMMDWHGSRVHWGRSMVWAIGVNVSSMLKGSKTTKTCSMVQGSRLRGKMVR